MKKTLSILLAFAMLVSLLPAVSVSAEGETERTALKYSFGYEGYGLTSEVPINTNHTQDTAAQGEEGYVEGTVSLARFDTDMKWANVDTSPWRVDGMRYVNQMTLKSGELWWSFLKGRLNSLYGTAILLDVGNGGEYTPVLEYQALAEGYVSDIYLVPADEKTIAAKQPFDFYQGTSLDGRNRFHQYISAIQEDEEYKAKYLLGTLDMQETTEDAAKEYKVFSTRSFEKKQYYLIFHIKDQTNRTGNAPELSMSSFELAIPGTVDIPKLSEVALSLDRTSLPVSRTANASVSLFYKDGQAFTDKATVTYKSSVDGIVEINNETGEITAIGEGETEITATAVTEDAAVTSDPVTLTVTPKPTVASLKFSDDEIIFLAGDTENNSVPTEISAVMSDGVIESAEGLTVSYKSSDENIATVDASGVVTAIAKGTAKITAFMMQDGEPTEITGSLTVTVYDELPSFTIDFSETVAKDDKSLPDVTPGYTILTEEGLADQFTKVAASDTGTSFFYANTWTSAGQEWPIKKNKDATFAFAFEAPVEGYYNVEILGGRVNQGAFYSIYTENDFVGDHSFWNGSTDATVPLTTGAPAKLNTVYLKRGTNKMYMRIRARGSGNPYVIVNSLTFTPAGDNVKLSHIDTSLPTELAVGETFHSDAVAYMTDGSVRHFGDKANDGSDEAKRLISASADNSGIEISGFDYVVGQTGSRGYTLTAASAGTTTVKISATLDGESFIEKSQTVKVTNDEITATSVTMAAEELFAGDSTYLTAHPVIGKDRVSYSAAITSEFSSSNTDVATVEGNLLTAHAVGTATITVTSTFNGKSVSNESFTVEVLPEGMTDVDATAGGSRHIRLTGIAGDNAPLYAQAISNLGRKLDMTNAKVEVEALTPELAYLTDNLYIVPVAEGEARFLVTVEHEGRIRTKEIPLTVAKAKSAATYRTAEKAANVRENVKKYDWAKSTAEQVIEEADTLVGNLDLIYDMIHSEGIPRGYQIGRANDPNAWVCRYCNVDLRVKYGLYSMQHNALSRPWKTQCPDCKRLFPSNDFESFYELGLNEYGEFDRQRALDAHRELFGDKTVTEPGKEHSKQWKQYYGYGVTGGYLTNEMYGNLENVKTINAGKGLREGETTETWGVDDGMGYIPSKDDGTPYWSYVDPKDSSKNEAEAHTYIAEYLHWGVWRNGVVYDAIVQCADAYYYTGDKKYGRVAAILLDRVADFYPDYDLSRYGSLVINSSGGSGNGKTVGSIWETNIVDDFIVAYDTIYDMYADDEVLKYIQEKQKTMKFRYAKETPSQLRTHVEDGILRAAYDGVMNFSVHGNFGMDQKIIASAAVVLDSIPETDDMLEFLMDSVWLEGATAGGQLGGGINTTLINDVDADGQGDESSQYNQYWISRLTGANDFIESHGGYEHINLKNNPKFIQMLYSNIWMMSTHYTPEIGDSQTTLSKSHWITESDALDGWKMTDDPVFAQVLYILNGNTEDGLHYSISEKNPQRLEDEVRAVIDEHGELSLPSKMLTNFGFGILRDGGDFTDGTGATGKETRRDVWMYFGSGSGHGHKDTLEIGLTAFGLNFLPDLGYPEETSTQPNRLQWVEATISHNTVTVNEEDLSTNSEIHGKAKHFDGDGTVKLMDVSAPYVYDAADEYRRSVVQIKVDDENSYVVDFFRVLGGSTHTYSLHASSNEVTETSGLDFTVVEDENGNYISGSQLDDNGNYKGTYAGRDAMYVKKTNADDTYSVRLPVPGETLAPNEKLLPVEYGQDPNSPAEWTYNTLYPRGYTWLRNVDRDTSPENKVEVDFAIKDYNKAVADSKNLHLRMTVLNDGNVKSGATSEIAIADGLPPQTAANKNIEKLKYVLVKNSGGKLDTVFTTVLEPYRAARYLKSSDEIEMRVAGDVQESEGDAHRAVRVEHTNGRVDYILYSTNNAVTYEITLDDGKPLSFRGFVGVYTVQNGANTYKYLNDGTLLGDAETSRSAITGTVKSFTTTLEFKNEIVITPDVELTDAEVTSLAGKYVHIDNGEKTRSGSFEIVGASRSLEDTADVVLDIGMVTPIRKFSDPYHQEKGYNYMIAEGQSMRIPETYTEDFAPVFDPVSESLSTSAGSAITVNVNAESPVKEETLDIKYIGTTLPRGASINETTGTVTWKPDSSQVGENHFAVTAVDEYGRESTVHFYVTVYGSTTSKPSASTETPSDGATDNSGSSGEGTSSGGGGGGGGGSSGQGTADTNPDGSAADNTGNDDETDNGEQTDGENSPEASGETDVIRFTDIQNHSWAADAINALASDGVIRGTTATTFSPAANITRADFALLLVRAFDLSSDNTENFADVNASDYFAPELAIARNTGIVNGIGDNKYAPRNTITRQDMMVIVYRALQASLALKGGGPSNDGGGIQAPAEYPDFNTVAPYARDAVSALISVGLVHGKSGRIAPADYTTRAEVAVLIKRIMDYLK